MVDFLLFADEGNPEQTDVNKFFCYGGTFIPTRHYSALSKAIEQLRNKYDLDRTDPLKFASRDRPKGMDVQTHTKLKNEVYSLAFKHEVKFCGYGILHAISRHHDHNTLVGFGANNLLSKFNQFLGENRAKGWANFDRMNTSNPFGYLREKFSHRIKSENERVQLENILGYSFTCDGASHASSVADILLGGFRYILNEPQRDIAGRAIAKELSSVMWHSPEPYEQRNFFDRGLVLRPKEISLTRYQADYQEIRDRFTRWVEVPD